MFGGAEVGGWVSYLVGQEEGNLMLVFDEMVDYDDERLRFAALEEGATLSVPPDLGEVTPTQLGVAWDSPALLGETVVTPDWEITVTEVVRGDDAWKMIQEANQFNDPPGDGMEYALARVRVRFGATKERADYIDGWAFRGAGAAGVIYDLPSVVEPEPQLSAALYPGGIQEGWVALLAAIGEEGLVAVSEPLFDFSGESTRYLALE